MNGLLLGVDVGNSKTHVAVADPAGRVLAFTEGPGASVHPIGVDAGWELLRPLLERVRAGAGMASDTAYAAAAYAVAGVDFPEEQQAFTEAAAAEPAGRHIVWNDTFAVLRAGTPSPRGIAVVAGAGVNCVGRFGDRSVRYPSLGRLSGDWGGGIELGAEALAAACRDADGRGPSTRLRRDVPRHFGLDEPAELTLAVHRGQLAAARLVELARLVLAGADAGDPVCTRLVRRQALEVVDLVRATAARLGVRPGQLPVLLGGGLLRAGCRTLDEAVRAGLAALDPRVDPRLAPGPPVVGALLLAADLLPGAVPAPEHVAGSLAALTAAVDLASPG